MKKLVFKIGGTFRQDAVAFAKGSKKPESGTTTVYLRDFKHLREMLTPKKLALLDAMISFADAKQNVSQIAKKLKRKQEAVSRDLAVLEKNGLIHKTKHKQHVHPALSFSIIQIELGKAIA
ncbi:MAG: ArsR family transcriptional regulator [Candidatus Micrarchaeota archaeon]